MATAKKEELKVLPGFSQGVRPTAVARLIVMAQPICPFSKITVELDSTGRPVPVKELREPNCQLAGGEWWKTCDEKGHDPYFTTHRWYTTEDVLENEKDDEGNETGRLIKTGERLIPHVEKRLNTAQVAAQKNINNGRGAIEAMEKKGFRRIKDFGYAEVCQMRNCQRLVSAEGSSRIYGSYCSKEHLAWFAAHVESDEGEPLDVTETRLGGYDTTRANKRRERRYREVLLGS